MRRVAGVAGARIVKGSGHKKTPDVAIRGFSDSGLAQDLDLVSLHAFLTLYGFEGNLLAFFQALEAVTFDSAEVYEQIRAALGSDEPKPFSSLNHLTVPV